VRPDSQQRQKSRIVFGVFIIAVGIVALLDNLHLFDARAVQPYWPLVFVALGVLKLSRHRHGRGYVTAGALIVVGALLTLQNLGVFHLQLRDWWPVLLILGGISVVTRGFRFRGDRDPARSFHGGRDERLEHGSRIEASAVLSGIVLRNDSQDFQGGDITAVMGGVELDLRQAAIVTDAVLHLSVVMGGIEIKVPREWSVLLGGMPILGGIEDKTVPPMNPGKRLVIEGSVIMGGVEISN
jgi:predicted membrane protein